MKNSTVKFLVYTGIGFVAAFLVMWRQDIFHAETAQDVFRFISDGFFVSGALLFLIGGFTWTYNGGALDGLGFSFKQGLARIRKSYDEDRMTFAQYREQREEKATSPKPMLLSGLVHLVIATAALVGYMLIAG